MHARMHQELPNARQMLKEFQVLPRVLWPFKNIANTLVSVMFAAHRIFYSQGALGLLLDGSSATSSCSWTASGLPLGAPGTLLGALGELFGHSWVLLAALSVPSAPLSVPRAHLRVPRAHQSMQSACKNAPTASKCTSNAQKRCPSAIQECSGPSETSQIPWFLRCYQHIAFFTLKALLDCFWTVLL